MAVSCGGRAEWVSVSHEPVMPVACQCVSKALKPCPCLRGDGLSWVRLQVFQKHAACLPALEVLPRPSPAARSPQAYAPHRRTRLRQQSAPPPAGESGLIKACFCVAIACKLHPHSMTHTHTHTHTQQGDSGEARTLAAWQANLVALRDVAHSHWRNSLVSVAKRLGRTCLSSERSSRRVAASSRGFSSPARTPLACRAKFGSAMRPQQVHNFACLAAGRREFLLQRWAHRTT
jgi:hypothetical protein